MKRFIKPTLGVAACLAAALGTYATIVMTGPCNYLVGKGDIQSACGWNNAQLQNNYLKVGFADLDYTDVYSAVCTFVTGEGTNGEQTHNVTIPRHVKAKTTPHLDDRTHKQVDGFFLDLCEVSSNGTPVPVVGEPCVAAPEGVAHNGTWSSVTLVSSGGNTDLWLDCDTTNPNNPLIFFYDL